MVYFGRIANNMVLKSDAATKAEILLLIIAIIKLAEFIYIIYTGYARRLRKPYNNSYGGARNYEMAWANQGSTIPRYNFDLSLAQDIQRDFIH